MGIFFSCKGKRRQKEKLKKRIEEIKYNNRLSQYNEYYNPIPSKNKFSTQSKKFVHFPAAL
jgi:hypothetical protein